MAFPNTRMLGPGFAPGKAMQLDVEYFDDFVVGGQGTTIAGKFATTADAAEWLATALSGSPTFAIKDDEIGGILQVDNGATTDNHGVELQLNGESFQIAADKDIYFEIRMASRNSVAALDWTVGLATTDTSHLASPGGNFIGFTSGAAYTGAVLDSGASNIIFRSNDDITSWASTVVGVDTGIDLVAGTYNTLAFWVQMSGTNARVRCYVDGAEKGNFTTVPDAGDPLTPTIAIQNNGSVRGILDIDYLYVCQKR